MNAFDRLIKHPNIRSRVAIARLLNISPQAVSKWRGVVPDGLAVLKLAAAADWQVRPHELRPDLYPHPDDGLPASHRGKQQEAA